MDRTTDLLFSTLIIFFSAFFDSTTLTTLILNNNPDLKEIPLPPAGLVSLELKNCGLNETRRNALDLSSLQNLPYLVELSLDNNGLTEWPINFPPKLGVRKNTRFYV